MLVIASEHRELLEALEAMLAQCVLQDSFGNAFPAASQARAAITRAKSTT